MPTHIAQCQSSIVILRQNRTSIQITGYGIYIVMVKEINIEFNQLVS